MSDHYMHPESSGYEPPTDGTANAFLMGLFTSLVTSTSQTKNALVRKWYRNVCAYDSGSSAMDAFRFEGDALSSVDQITPDKGHTDNRLRATLDMKQAFLLYLNIDQTITPLSNDPGIQDKVQKTKKAIKVIQRSIGMDDFMERTTKMTPIYGQAFWYTYFDENKGRKISVPELEEKEEVLVPERSYCPSCQREASMRYPDDRCPMCGMDTELQEAVTNTRLVETGRCHKKHTGEVHSKVVSPFQVYLPPIVESLEDAPWLIRLELMDRAVLQADYPDVPIQLFHSRQPDVTSDVLNQVKHDYNAMYRMYGFGATQYAKQFTAEKFTMWLKSPMYREEEELLARFPDGMKVCINGGNVLSVESEDLTEHWVHVPSKRVPDKLWAAGEADDLIEAQDNLDTLLEIYFLSLLYNGVGRLIVDPTMVDPAQFTGNPALAYQANVRRDQQISNAVFPIPSSNVSQDAQVMLQKALESFGFLSQMFPSMIGMGDQNANSAQAVARLADQALRVLKPQLILLSSALCKLYRQQLNIAKKEWTGNPRMYVARSPDGAHDFEEIDGEDLLDDVQFDTALSNPTGEYDHRQLVGDALNKGLLNPQDPRILNRSLAEFGLEDFYPDYNIERQRAMRNIDKIITGQADQIGTDELVDDHTVHAMVAMEFLRKDEGQRLQMEEEPKYQAIRAYMQAHLSAAMKNMKEAARFQAQMLFWDGVGDGIGEAPEGAGAEFARLMFGVVNNVNRSLAMRQGQAASQNLQGPPAAPPQPVNPESFQPQFQNLEDVLG